jgi:hypothetical protein
MWNCRIIWYPNAPKQHGDMPSCQNLQNKILQIPEIGMLNSDVHRP